MDYVLLRLVLKGRLNRVKKKFVPSKVEFVMFDGGNIIRTSDECDFDCPGNCSCHFCVGVCTFDCTADDSTCRTGDWN